MAKWLFPPQEDKGCWWYCDNCGALLNAQPGFTTVTDEWTCAACGEENDVSENNSNALQGHTRKTTETRSFNLYT